MKLHVIPATLLAIALVAPAMAQESKSQGGGGGGGNGKTYTLRVCAKSGDDVVVGVSYIPVGQSRWRNTGWIGISAGNCKNVLTTGNSIYYARAEVDGDQKSYWAGGDNAIAQCVEYPGPYDFSTGSDDTTCPEGDAKDMERFSTDPGVYTWNLNN